jgi:hypothetical protein
MPYAGAYKQGTLRCFQLCQRCPVPLPVAVPVIIPVVPVKSCYTVAVCAFLACCLCPYLSSVPVPVLVPPSVLNIAYSLLYCACPLLNAAVLKLPASVPLKACAPVRRCCHYCLCPCLLARLCRCSWLPVMVAYTPPFGFTCYW